MTFNLAVILRETASATPGQAVAVYEGGRLSYGELDALSGRLAAGLDLAGLRPGDRVGLQLPNIPRFLVAYFGILKAGGVVVPLNVMYKAPEVAFHLGHCGARIFITWAGVLAQAAAGAEAAGVTEVYAVGQAGGRDGAQPFERLLAAPPNGALLAETSPTDTAVIMYTSGTTGRPKGAELTHMQLYMNADIPGRLFDVRPDDVVITVLPMFHIFGPVQHRERLRAVRLHDVFDAAVRPGRRAGCDPARPGHHLRGRSRHVHRPACPPRPWPVRPSSLRIAISGGASIPAPVLDAFEQRFGVVILEGYGLTETASTTTFNRSASDRRVYSVGKPIWGTQTQVRDETGQALSPGEANVGQVVTRGLHVMKGYLNNAEATAEAFSGGWFHAGDLGYFDEDGFLFIAGRVKELIIRGGCNVYPLEIEDVLHAHPAVAEAAVVGIPDDRLGEEVMAVVTVRPGAALTAGELIEFCKERMAAYKYPRVVEFRPELPKNALGKILKDELVPG